jgi:hypothetical protein
MPPEAAALTACLVLAALAAFQAALIAGAPLGRMAWGGGHAVLPTGYRVGSAVSIVLYSVIASALLSRAGLLPGGRPPVLGGLVWGLAGYFAVGVVMNAVSRSRPERLVMTPVALALAILCAMVAAG